MKPQNVLAPTALVLAAASACLPQSPNLSVGPRIGQVRVIDSVAGRTYEGPIVGVDSTRLEMFDLGSETRITISAGQPVTIRVYRGQRHGADVAAKNAARGAAAGVAAGLFTALVSKAILGDDFDFGEGVETALVAGISVGGIGGVFEAWNEGEPAWETITLRQLYQDVQGFAPTRNAEPQSD